MLADPSAVRGTCGATSWRRHPCVIVIVVVLLLTALNHVVPVQEVLPAAVGLLPVLQDCRVRRATPRPGEARR
ncbi:hypothetical protein [Streptomyces sp. NPDC018045]|uniref:hypothetical protein n=1 Tax=Streptomyces sp. NPDC018045 TaxID=3365037 RepID=UPI0037886D85